MTTCLDRLIGWRPRPVPRGTPGIVRNVQDLVSAMRSTGSTWLIRCVAALVISPAIVGLRVSASAAGDTTSMRLGAYDFEIPEQYLQDDPFRAPGRIGPLPGYDNGRELLLTVSASEVAAAVPDFQPKNGRYDDDLRIRLVVLEDDEKQRYLDPVWMKEAWDGSGSYSDRIIEEDGETHFFRAYRRVEYPYSWEVFRVSPDGPAPPGILSLWVGHCLNSHSPLTPSGSLALCKSYVVAGDVALNFTTSTNNIVRIDAIRHYLTALVSQWLKTPPQSEKR